MIRVGGVAVADNLAINFRAALFGAFQFFKNKDARAFAHDEAVAVFVERTRRVFRVVVARAHGAHRAKSADADGHDGRFRAAGEHHLSVAHFHGAPCFADGVIGRGAGGNGGEVRAAQIFIHREKSRSHVADEHRNHERREPSRPALEQNFQLVAGRLQSADAGAEDAADFIAIFFCEIEAGIQERLMSGENAELRIAVRATDIFRRWKCRRRVEIFHFTGDLRVEIRGVEGGNFINAALAGNQIFPEGFNLVSQRRHDAEAGDDDTAFRPIGWHKIKGQLKLVSAKLPRSLHSRNYFWFSSTYLVTSPTVRSFSACSSGTSMPNSSSSAMINSTMSSESAPRSSTNFASGVT